MFSLFLYPLSYVVVVVFAYTHSLHWVITIMLLILKEYMFKSDITAPKPKKQIKTFPRCIGLKENEKQFMNYSCKEKGNKSLITSQRATNENIKTCPLKHRLVLKEYDKHYLCDGCHKQGNGPRFRCEPCDYDLHKECMVKSDISSQKPVEEKVKTCPLKHQLLLKGYKKQYLCDGCKEEGQGARYRCGPCNYELHKECMFTNNITSHEFLEKSELKFYNVPQKNYSAKKCNNSHSESERYCDGCGMVVEGFVYHCKANGWDLHPCCKNLPNEINIHGIKFRLQDKVSRKCIFCNQKNHKDTVSGIRGWSYVSQCKNYHFHVKCGKQKVLDELRGTSGDYDDSLTLENLELPLQTSGRNTRTVKFAKILRIFLRTIGGVLLGDPTIVVSLLGELISN